MAILLNLVKACQVGVFIRPLRFCVSACLIVLPQLTPPPSGYSRLGPAASIINVVMVTVAVSYITVHTMSSLQT